MTVKWGSNFDDDLAGAPQLAVDDPDLAGLEDRVKMEFEQVFMFYLPRICEHCRLAVVCPNFIDATRRSRPFQ